MAHKTGLEDYYITKIIKNFALVILRVPVRQQRQKALQKSFLEEK